MLAPQSDDEIRPIIEALRRRDGLLDIVWNPKAICTTRGRYDGLGRPVAAEYDGRWEVIRYSTAAALRVDRDYTSITLVTEVVMDGTIPVMVSEGAYAPIGWWLVDYMALWDRAQDAAQEAMARLWAEHDAIDELRHEESRAAHQEGLEKVYRVHGGEYWMGGAQGKASPESAAALWPAKAGTP